MPRTSKDPNIVSISIKIPKEQYETYSALLLLTHQDSDVLINNFINDFIEKGKDIINFDKLSTLSKKK
jgi:hypothetical protein